MSIYAVAMSIQSTLITPNTITNNVNLQIIEAVSEEEAKGKAITTLCKDKPEWNMLSICVADITNKTRRPGIRATHKEEI